MAPRYTSHCSRVPSRPTGVRTVRPKWLNPHTMYGWEGPLWSHHRKVRNPTLESTWSGGNCRGQLGDSLLLDPHDPVWPPLPTPPWTLPSTRATGTPSRTSLGLKSGTPRELSQSDLVHQSPSGGASVRRGFCGDRGPAHLASPLKSSALEDGPSPTSAPPPTSNEGLQIP